MARALQSEGLEFESRITTRPGEAIEMARQALLDGCRQVVAVGGDGTVHEVVNGFFQNGTLINPRAVLGVIPRGTGSDLARTLNLPHGLAPLAEMLQTPGCQGWRSIDLGRITYLDHQGDRAERYFVNLSDVGLGGDTCWRVNSASKALGGFASFLWGMLASLSNYRNQAVSVVIDEEEVYRGRAVTVAVANGQYFGGGMRMAPRAVVDDGLFDVVIAKDLSRPDLLANLYRVYRGTHLTHPKISWHRGSRVQVRALEPEHPPLLEVDGEQLGHASASYEILPSALKIMAAAGASPQPGQD